MTPTVVLPVVIGGLYAAGVFLLLDRSLTRVLLGFLLLGNATNLLLISAAGPAGSAPLLGRGDGDTADPLPQAFVLTSIVITFGVSAFLLAVIHRSWRLARQEAVEADEEDRRLATREGRRSGREDPDEIDPDRLAAEDRRPFHAEPPRRRGQLPPGTPADDVDLPPARRRSR
ncbi:Na(+)/H(+) antiporter subunit C [Geodermatophilus sp. SYSU D00525]